MQGEDGEVKGRKDVAEDRNALCGKGDEIKLPVRIHGNCESSHKMRYGFFEMFPVI